MHRSLSHLYKLALYILSKLPTDADYRVSVFTGNIPGAGTTADIFVQLTGLLGSGREHWLRPSRQMFDHSGNSIHGRPTTASALVHDKPRRSEIVGSAGALLPSQLLQRPMSRLGQPVPIASTKPFASSSLVLASRRAQAAALNRHWFERNTVVQVRLEGCRHLGELVKLRVGHNNRGDSPSWFLEKIIVDDMTMGRVYEFPCHRWLAKNEDDGSVTRDLVSKVAKQPARKTEQKADLETSSAKLKSKSCCKFSRVSEGICLVMCSSWIATN
ncbi:unnamed protein product [Protopolystoma xenopodis]|uniref:PLAT domain-containing protein n=1 Tax=Protopolystoma xenopodis TaxID=117903 RepID=A0A448WML6_9PLAT|nr:unnamed protein product [Protopolystoma xenopodis]